MSKNPSFKLESFREAAPYIYSHRGKTFVIYLCDSIISGKHFPSLIHDLALVHTLGVKLVLVLGMRSMIDKKLGNNTRFHNHLRITKSTEIKAITELVGQVRSNTEALFSLGLINTPMSGMKLNVVSGNFVRAKPVGIRDGIDHLYTGEVRNIDVDEIQNQLMLDNMVLLTPLGYSKTGDVFNLSTIDIALRTSCELQCEKLILMVDKFKLPGNKNQHNNHFNINEARELVKKLPKSKSTEKYYVEIAIQGCLENVKRVHIISDYNDGSLLEELFTVDGVATLVTAETYDEIRPATINDVGGILTLIQPLIEKGALLERNQEQLELEIDNFDVIERDGIILACGAMHTFKKENTAEIACLAVHPEFQSNGRGSKMLEHLEKKAIHSGLQSIFLLTTQTAHWFQERGFKKTSIEKLPIKKRAFFNYQRNSKAYNKKLL